MPFPSPPWKLRGDLWLSLFAVRSSGTTDRPPGMYGAAFTDYQEGGVLAYRELAVGRLVRDGVAPRVHITDIWVDSERSRDGGRALWALPKELADLHVEDGRLGPAYRTAWSAHIAGEPVAAARFAGANLPAVRTPLMFSTFQTREDGTSVVARVSGNARSLPGTGRWEFGGDGPLAWMRGQRQLLSFRVSDFRLDFGG